MEKNVINISILKGDKLFNANTPFVINLSTPQPDENDKKSNVDLICVIDVSGSMYGEKIGQVRESLKILLTLMDERDRLCLILFNENGTNYYDLNYLTKENKKILIEKINKIISGGGTNILSGLKLAIDVLKRQNNNEKNVSSILLLSDGCDNYYNDIQLANSLKQLTKGLGLSFTLNTFGYGHDHDAKIMNKLANLRDGTFFYVENYSNITEYFVSILGGCVSVISKKVDVNLQVLNANCKIKKVFGEDKLYSHQSCEKFFKTTMLQFICGREYTFVLELYLDEQKVQIGEEILKVEITYEDISEDNKKVKAEQKYKYCLKDLEFLKANEEYIRVHVYFILDEVMKLKDVHQNEKGKKLLEDLEGWLIKNYRGKNSEYLKDIKNAKGLFSKNEFEKLRSYNYTNCSIQNNAFKRTEKSFKNCNSIQLNMIRSIRKEVPFENKKIISNPIPNNFIKIDINRNNNHRIANHNIYNNNHYIMRNKNRFIKETNNLNEPKDNKNLINNHTFIKESNNIQNGYKVNFNNTNNRIVYNRKIIGSNNGNNTFGKNNTFISSKSNIVNSIKDENSNTLKNIKNNNFNGIK